MLVSLIVGAIGPLSPCAFKMKMGDRLLYSRKTGTMLLATQSDVSWSYPEVDLKKHTLQRST